MDLPEALRQAALHALSFTCVGLLVLAGVLMAIHYLTNRKRFS